MSAKHRKGNMPVALLAGLGLPALGLFSVFSLVSYDQMTARWPLGITGEEVHAYQRWFDQRPDTMPAMEVDRLELMADGPCDDARNFTLEGTTGHVALTMAGADRILSFAEAALWNGQHTVRLVPADRTSVSRLYAAEVARGLGVACGKAALVRLSLCGSDQGLFLALEETDQPFVDVHGADGEVALGGGAHVDTLVLREAELAMKALTASGDISRIDARSAAVIGAVMAATGEGGVPGTASFEPRSGLYRPLLGGHAKDTVNDPGAHALAWYLGTADAHQRMRALADSLRIDSAALERRLAELDARNASAFTSEMRIGYVRATLGHGRMEFLRRLFHPEHGEAASRLASDGVQARVPAQELDPLLRRYLVGDTVRLPRDKHLIDHVITVPAGYGLVLEKGARLNMAPGSGIVVHGALHARGTKLNPVFIRPVDENAPWAGIHVTGTGATRCVMAGLRMSGGGAPLGADGAPGAMLVFQGCDVTVTGGAISGSNVGAAIAVRHGKLALHETYLAGGRSAQLDITFGDLDATACSFVGDGARGALVAHGALITLTDVSFSRYGGAAVELALRSQAKAQRVSFSGDASDKNVDATSRWEEVGVAVGGR